MELTKQQLKSRRKYERKKFREVNNLQLPDNHSVKNAAYKRRYGITLHEVHQRLVEQLHRCAICLTPFVNETPNVDHDHTTNEVRGLLCGKCNKGIGCFNDDPEIMQRAIKYLAIFSS